MSVNSQNIREFDREKQGVRLISCGDASAAVNVFRSLRTTQPANSRVHSRLIHAMHFVSGASPDAIFAEQQEWSLCHVHNSVVRQRTFDYGLPLRGRLKVGFVSSEFRSCVLSLYLLPLLSNRDRQSFHVTLYSDTSSPDAVTSRLMMFCDDWRDISNLSDDDVANQVRYDGIDILIDLALHCGNHRLLVFSKKPAPVQACMFGYHGGTGLQAMDFRLTDQYLDPPDDDCSCYTERTVRLPNSVWCYDWSALLGKQIQFPDVGGLPAISNGFVTFGCLNDPRKINRECLLLWSEILLSVPKSKLLLIADDPIYQLKLSQFLFSQGIPTDRLIFKGRQRLGEYLNVYNEVDIFLDTLPYNAHTTGLDAFWMGVPVVSQVGKTPAGRAGLSHASNLGHVELVAFDESGYISIARELASDLQRLRELRRSLRRRMLDSKLTDSHAYAKGIELALINMHVEATC